MAGKKHLRHGSRSLRGGRVGSVLLRDKRYPKTAGKNQNTQKFHDRECTVLRWQAVAAARALPLIP